MLELTLYTRLTSNSDLPALPLPPERRVPPNPDFFFFLRDKFSVALVILDLGDQADLKVTDPPASVSSVMESKEYVTISCRVLFCICLCVGWLVGMFVVWTSEDNLHTDPRNQTPVFRLGGPLPAEPFLQPSDPISLAIG